MSGAGARSPRICRKTKIPTPPIATSRRCDASNNIVFSENPTKIALLGVHNLIVIQTDDAILVCSRHDAEKIKNLVGKLPSDLQ